MIYENVILYDGKRNLIGRASTIEISERNIYIPVANYDDINGGTLYDIKLTDFEEAESYKNLNVNNFTLIVSLSGLYDILNASGFHINNFGNNRNGKHDEMFISNV